MRKLTLILAAAGCVGLAAPAFPTEKAHVGQSATQAATDLGAKGAYNEFSSQNKEKQAKKKKRKNGTTSRSSWGG